MNYRHIYHAGNFADVLKHLVLLICLDYLQRKEGALCIIDAQAGAGLYDLNSEQASKTAEWENGIGRLFEAGPAPKDIDIYLDLVRQDLKQRQYPGSPLLIARRLRMQDRLVANELHRETFDALQETLKGYPNVQTLEMDAYQCIRSRIPPKERRGLVLIDSPFELKNEFQILAKQMREWKKRWATGVYILWYPIKAHLAVDALKEAAKSLAFRRTWCVEILVGPRTRPETLNGCGLIIFNTPYTVPERVETVLPFLKDALRLHDGCSEWEIAEV